jgi:hypothetical protein
MTFLSLLLNAANIGVGAAIGNTKGRVLAGAVLAMLFGPPGWLLVMFGPNCREDSEFVGPLPGAQL